jgi:hypothetical protein
MGNRTTTDQKPSNIYETTIVEVDGRKGLPESNRFIMPMP